MIMPNSGFVHALKHIGDQELETLDLSGLKSLLTAGEPASVMIIEEFFKKFARAGLERKSFSNAYGQTESTSLISESPSQDGISIDRIDAVLFREKGLARRVPDSFDGSILTIISCGPPIWGVTVKIVDKEGRELPERQAGEVLVKGGVVFRGYHLNPELTAETVREGWLRTGDVGYLAGGELYICGRKKDLIITGGKNVRPGDIEEVVYGCFPDCVLCVAFGIYDEAIGTEQVILVCEWTRALAPREAMKVEKTARKLIFSSLSVFLDDFRIVAQGWIGRTQTRKISRRLTGDKYRREFGEG